VISKILETSEKALGPPPCQYVAVAVGSVARGEVSPYSNLEYMFIIESEERRDYFNRLALDRYFRFANLGEIPLKYALITALWEEMKVLRNRITNHAEKFQLLYNNCLLLNPKSRAIELLTRTNSGHNQLAFRCVLWPFDVFFSPFCSIASSTENHASMSGFR